MDVEFEAQRVVSGIYATTSDIRTFKEPQDISEAFVCRKVVIIFDAEEDRMRLECNIDAGLENAAHNSIERRLHCMRLRCNTCLVSKNDLYLASIVQDFMSERVYAAYNFLQSRHEEVIFCSSDINTSIVCALKYFIQVNRKSGKGYALCRFVRNSGIDIFNDHVLWRMILQAVGIDICLHGKSGDTNEFFAISSFDMSRYYEPCLLLFIHCQLVVMTPDFTPIKLATGTSEGFCHQVTFRKSSTFDDKGIILCDGIRSDSTFVVCNVTYNSYTSMSGKIFGNSINRCPEFFPDCIEVPFTDDVRIVRGFICDIRDFGADDMSRALFLWENLFSANPLWRMCRLQQTLKLDRTTCVMREIDFEEQLRYLWDNIVAKHPPKWDYSNACMLLRCVGGLTEELFELQSTIRLTFMDQEGKDVSTAMAMLSLFLMQPSKCACRIRIHNVFAQSGHLKLRRYGQVCAYDSRKTYAVPRMFDVVFMYCDDASNVSCRKTWDVAQRLVRTGGVFIIASPHGLQGEKSHAIHALLDAWEFLYMTSSPCSPTHIVHVYLRI